MKKIMRNILHVLFGILAVLAVYEYLFVCGMFTAPMMFLALLIVGLVNVIWSCIEKKWMIAYLYLLATVGLCLGYFKVMFL